MTEHIFDLQFVDHLSFFGAEDSNLNEMKRLFPKLKIIVRGDMVKIMGADEDVDEFIPRFEFLVSKFEMYGKLAKKDIAETLNDFDKGERTIAPPPTDVILYGRNGYPIKVRTENQRRMLNDIQQKDMMFCVGPAGTGKTYTAVALAVKFLKEKLVKRIVLTRPAVEAGENLGFLPGDLRDKLDPYLQPLYDALRNMLPQQKLESFYEDKTIEIAPLAFMRGRTLDNAFVILDEAQNSTQAQMKMFLTRMGNNSKFVITGDVTQIDLPKNQSSGLSHAVNLFKDVQDFSVILLDERDVVRHSLVNKIIKIYDNEESNH